MSIFSGLYQIDKTNPFHIQGYLRCLIKDKTEDHTQEIEELLGNLERIINDRAKIMYLTSKAQYFAYCKNDFEKGMEIVEEAIARFSDSIYPKMTKFELCERFKQVDAMSSTLTDLEQMLHNNPAYAGMICSMRAKLIALKGNVRYAIEYAKSHLTNYYPEGSVNHLIDLLRSYNT